MHSKIALRLAGLVLGAAFVSTPALAQYLGPPQSPGIGPNGDPRYGLHNEAPYFGGPTAYSYAPGYYDYSSGGGYLGGAPGGYYDYSSGGIPGGYYDYGTVRHDAYASGGAGTHSTAVRTGSAINRTKIHRSLNGYPPY
jgi:hypothetical protein